MSIGRRVWWSGKWCPIVHPESLRRPDDLQAPALEDAAGGEHLPRLRRPPPSMTLSGEEPKIELRRLRTATVRANVSLPPGTAVPYTGSDSMGVIGLGRHEARAGYRCATCPGSGVHRGAGIGAVHGEVPNVDGGRSTDRHGGRRRKARPSSESTNASLKRLSHASCRPAGQDDAGPMADLLPFRQRSPVSMSRTPPCCPRVHNRQRHSAGAAWPRGDVAEGESRTYTLPARGSSPIVTWIALAWPPAGSGRNSVQTG